MTTCPSEGKTNVAIMFIKKDFPEPFGQEPPIDHRINSQIDIS
jgi:hypothetical protein